jgi:hypothetical protein
VSTSPPNTGSPEKKKKIRDPEQIIRCSLTLLLFMNQNLLNGYREISYPRFYGKYKIVGFGESYSRVKEE